MYCLEKMPMSFFFEVCFFLRLLLQTQEGGLLSEIKPTGLVFHVLRYEVYGLEVLISKASTPTIMFTKFVVP